jgi:hypothetical protein
MARRAAVLRSFAMFDPISPFRRRARTAKRLPAAWLAGALVLAGAARVAAAAPAPNRFDDTGVYRVYQGKRPLGTETFSFEPHGDSIFVFSRVLQVLPRGDAVDSLDKQVGIVFSAADFDLRGYESHQRLRGVYLARALELSDTSLTAVREGSEAGTATVLIRPPGRVFVLDPQAFVLFDIIFRYLHTSSLDERPVPILFLGSRDTVLNVTARKLGTEPMKWGTQTVQAQKVSLSDERSQFTAWMSPQGRMLRLTQDAVGLRVERGPSPPAAAAKKPAAASKPQPGR